MRLPGGRARATAACRARRGRFDAEPRLLHVAPRASPAAATCHRKQQILLMTPASRCGDRAVVPVAGRGIRYPRLLCRAWQAVGALFDAVAHTSVATEERAKTIMWRARRQFKKKAKVAEAGTYLYFTSLLAFVVAAKAARPSR